MAWMAVVLLPVPGVSSDLCICSCADDLAGSEGALLAVHCAG